MSRSKEGFILGKNDRIQLAREIIARVKREMQLPQLDGVGPQRFQYPAAPASEKSFARSERGRVLILSVPTTRDCNLLGFCACFVLLAGFDRFGEPEDL